MVGAMTLKLAENASLEEMVRFGVAAGSAATLNQGTRLCSHDDTQKFTLTFPANKNIPLHWGNHHQPVGNAFLRLCSKVM